MRGERWDLESTVQPGRLQILSPHNLLDMLMPRHSDTGSAMAAQRREVTVRTIVA
jgi:hypothetical protein